MRRRRAARRPQGSDGAQTSDFQVVTENKDQTLAMRRLSWREKVSYGVADMGFNFYWANIATFLMIFYTDVFGISAAAAGSMLFTIKIINAFTDPMIGAAADRTQTRFGQFRPYLIWMAIPLAVATRRHCLQ